MTISINLGKAYFVRPSQYGSSAPRFTFSTEQSRARTSRASWCPTAAEISLGAARWRHRLRRALPAANRRRRQYLFPEPRLPLGNPEAMAKMARREPVADNLYYMRTCRSSKRRPASTTGSIAMYSWDARRRPPRVTAFIIQGAVEPMSTPPPLVPSSAHPRRKFHRSIAPVVHRRALAGRAER
jgi:hypothetical protein